jgi:hypothetical protein
MGQVMKSGKVRLLATVEPDVAEVIENMADELDMSVSRLLGLLLGFSVHQGADAVQELADTLERLRGRG